MDRGDFVLVGCGGAGGNIADAIAMMDERYESYFFNTSMTDIQSLDSYAEDIKNFYTISTQNGVGRNKQLGEAYAEKRAANMIDLLLKFQQKTIFLISSFGGGSGSSIISILLEKIDDLGDDFDKNINLIGALPSLKSPEVILENTLTTWNKVMPRKCLNSMMFIDNNSHIEGDDVLKDIDKERMINTKFAELFDSIFDIPEDNGTNFDVGNLSNILNDKGCIYAYNMPNNSSSITVGLSSAENNSVLAKMYRNEKNIIEHEGKSKIKCGHLGLSVSNNIYSMETAKSKFFNTKEHYFGTNVYENNLLLVSGCFPPLNAMELIQKELNTRKDKKKNDSYDFSSFVVSDEESSTNNEIANIDNYTINDNNTISDNDNNMPSSLEEARASIIQKKTANKRKNDIFKRRVK